MTDKRKPTQNGTEELSSPQETNPDMEPAASADNDDNDQTDHLELKKRFGLA